jgi:1,4-dihydroxy-2-naphthoate octaprenyltransferase
MTPGRAATFGGLRSQVKPTFMVPAVGMSLFGGFLAPAFAVVPAALHALAVGSALYVAHLVDEYVDAHVRGEEAPQVPERTLWRATVGASALCLGCLGGLWLTRHRLAAVLGLPLLVLALLHAPYLDRHPLTVTVDYPVGIALAVVGGYAAQRAALAAGVVGIAFVFVVLLSGVKVSIDRLDYDFDLRVGKRTVPVALGDRRAAWASAALPVGAAAVVVALAGVAILPDGAFLAVPVLLLSAVTGLDRSPARATRRQMGLVYPVAVVLFVAQCVATGCVFGRAIAALWGG